MEMRFNREAISKLKYDPEGCQTQLAWEKGGSNLGISLSPRGRHVWIARVYILQPDQTLRKRVGRLFRKASVQEKSLEEARQMKKVWDGEAAQGIDPIEKRRPAGRTRDWEGMPGEPASPPTISVLLRRFLEEYVSQEVEVSTQRNYRKLLEHLDRHLGEVDCHRLSATELTALRREFANRRETFNRLRKLLSLAYKTATREEWKHGGVALVPSGFNPASLVAPLDSKVTRKGGNPFEPEEIEKLIEHARSQLPKLKSPVRRSKLALPLFLLFTGLRKNEGAGLTWTNEDLPKETGWRGWIDRRQGVIHLVHHKSSRRKGKRVVPLTPQALKVLAILDGGDETWVFVGLKAGRPICTSDASWRRFQKAAGITRVRGLHQTRHTFITRALEAGAPIGAVGRAVGHSTAYVTDIYGHISDRAARAAAELASDGIHKLSLEWKVGAEG